MRRGWIAAGLVSALALGSAPAQAQGVGPYIRVPHPAGDVYIPLDAAGVPALPSGISAVPGSPSAPSAPSTPSTPAAPAAPAPPERPVESKQRGGGYFVIDKP